MKKRPDVYRFESPKERKRREKAEARRRAMIRRIKQKSSE